MKESAPAAAPAAASEGGALRRVVPVAVPVVLTAAFYSVLATIRAHQYGLLWFVHLGARYQHRAHDPVLSGLPPQSPVGYDGQYYFALAAHPLHPDPLVTSGQAGYVYSRPLYPLLSRAVVAGSVGRIPAAMLVVNLVAVVVGTAAVALWLRRRGVSPLFALVYGLWPGLLFCAFRDLTEPLAFALVALAVLVFDPDRTGRLAASAALLALALLTRETVLPFVLACAAALLSADRPARGAPGRAWLSPDTWRRGAALLAAACLPLLAWRIVLAAWLHQPTQERGRSVGWALPFGGIAAHWPFDAEHWLILLAVVLPAVGAAAAACTRGVLRRRPVAAGLLLLNVLLFVVFLPAEVDVDFGAASRAAVGVALAAVYVVPALAESGLGPRRLGAGALVLSLGWYLAVASALGLPALHLVTT